MRALNNASTETHSYLVLHAKEGVFKGISAGLDETFTAEQLAIMIVNAKKNGVPIFPPNRKLVLLSCNDEASTKALVEALGELEGAPRSVIAWSGEVKVFENGRIEGAGACKEFRAEQAAQNVTSPPVGKVGAEANGAGVVLTSRNYTQAELEQVFSTLTPGNSKNYLPGSVEHKADRWMQYKESGGTWSYDRWSNTYASNMAKAREAHKAVDDYLNTLPWSNSGVREHSISVTLPNNSTATRRLDIANPSIRKGVEVKSYETGIVYQSDFIRTEIAMDKSLIENENWIMEWVFIKCRPSTPLENSLRQAGITIILK